MLSVVIPVYNEAESLEALHGELADVAKAEGYDLDVVFVDDGSTDGSWDVLVRPGRRPILGSGRSASAATSARRRP